MTSQPLFRNNFRVTNFADTIKIATMFIKQYLLRLKKVKRITNSISIS